MDKSNSIKIKKAEMIILSIILYGIILVYTYHFLKIANKNGVFGPDEFFYYLEAKAVSAHNIYQTPLSLDGNTSLIGDFGSHGISYAIKDGWLAKVFFQSDDPPIVFINFLTCLLTVMLILIFKRFSMTIRIKIALIVVTSPILYYYTLSYMQETIQFLFAVLALRILYLLYQQPKPESSKYLYYYLLVIFIAITFRYGWFIWGLGTLPLITNFKSVIKWGCIIMVLVLFALFIGRYIYAPYPYEEIVAYKIIRTENLSILDSINIVFQKFINNLSIFLSPDKSIVTTSMRYMLLALLIAGAWYSFTKRNKFTIACTLIGWGYLIACLAFYFLAEKADERILAILNPLLAFSLVGNSNSIIFYPVILLQLLLFPSVAQERNTNLAYALSAIDTPTERISRVASYSKLKYLITDEEPAVVAIPIQFVMFSKNYFIFSPLVTSKGYPIHYYTYINGSDLRGTHRAKYRFSNIQNIGKNEKLIYSDQWMFLYKILE